MANEAESSGRSSLRFRIGIAAFIAAFAVHLVTLGALLAGAGATTVATIGAIAFVLNKVLLVAAVAFLGREGFAWLKDLVFGKVRGYLLPDQVGPVRYGVGLFFFFVPIILAWVAPYVAELAPSIGRNTLREGIVSDLFLVVGLVLLGGDFWEKLRSLFVRRARVVFPGADKR